MQRTFARLPNRDPKGRDREARSTVDASCVESRPVLTVRARQRPAAERPGRRTTTVEVEDQILRGQSRPRSVRAACSRRASRATGATAARLRSCHGATELARAPLTALHSRGHDATFETAMSASARGLSCRGAGAELPSRGRCTSGRALAISAARARMVGLRRWLSRGH